MSTRRPSHHPPPKPRSFHDQRVVVPIMAVAIVFIVITDGAILTVALPSIAQRFHLSSAGLDGVVVVYPVCVATVIPASAWLLERYGGRRVLLLALALFTVASGLCGAAQNLPQLIAFRGLQGMAAGALMPTSQTLIFRTFSQHEQIRLSRIMIVPQQIAPAIAPLLGGVLVVTLDWRWIFYINVPIGVAAVLFGLLFLGEHRDGHAPRLDLTGLLLSAAAMGSLMYGVCDGPDRGWTAPSVVVSLAAGAILLTVAVYHQLHTTQPALRLRLFRDRMFRKASLVNLVGLISVMGTMFLIPLFVQQAQGRDALASGSASCTEALGVLLTMQLVGVVYQRIGPGPIIAYGLICTAAVEVLLATCDAHTGLWTLRLYMFLLGLAMGAFFIPVIFASVTTLNRADSSQAAMLGSVVRQSGLALAPTVVTTMLVLGYHHPTTATTPAATPTPTPPVAAYQHTFLVLAGIAILAGIYALSLGRTRIAPPDATTSPAPPAPNAGKYRAPSRTTA